MNTCQIDFTGLTPVNHLKFQASTKFAFCYFHVSWKFSTLAGFTVELLHKAAQGPGGKRQENGNMTLKGWGYTFWD